MTRTRAIIVLAIALAQAAVVALVPLDKIRARRTGKTVYLSIQPLDPYSLLRGYYQNIAYDISQPSRFDWRAVSEDGESTESAEAAARAEIPEWEETQLRNNDTTEARAQALNTQREQVRGQTFHSIFEAGAIVYAVIEETSGPTWQLVEYRQTPPENLPPNRAYIKGRTDSWRITYGIEEFFFPESQIGVMEEEFRDRAIEGRAEVKVDSRGTAAIMALHFGDKVFQNR